MQLMQGLSRLSELRFSFPRWVSESTDRRLSAGEVRNPSWNDRNTEIRCGNTRNTPKKSLQFNICKVYIGFQNSDFAFRGDFRNLQIGAILLVRSVISPETSEVQKYAVEIQEIFRNSTNYIYTAATVWIFNLVSTGRLPLTDFFLYI